MLGQNFPNPFNASSLIGYAIPEALSDTYAELTVFDLQGQVVKRLVSQQLPAGNYVAHWDGANEKGTVTASGVYFYHLTVGHQRRIGKMMLIK